MSHHKISPARYILLVLIIAAWLAMVVLVVSDTAAKAEEPIITATADYEVQDEAERIDEAITQNLVYAGTFTVTAYSADYECCGKHPDDPAYGITASGSTVEEGRTIASDWTVLPKGTEVYIDGIGYRTVEDKGGAIKGQDIDLYFEEYQDAVNFGVQEIDVWIVPENEKAALSVGADKAAHAKNT